MSKIHIRNRIEAEIKQYFQENFNQIFLKNKLALEDIIISSENEFQRIFKRLENTKEEILLLNFNVKERIEILDLVSIFKGLLSSYDSDKKTLQSIINTLKEKGDSINENGIDEIKTFKVNRGEILNLIKAIKTINIRIAGQEIIFDIDKEKDLQEIINSFLEKEVQIKESYIVKIKEGIKNFDLKIKELQEIFNKIDNRQIISKIDEIIVKISSLNITSNPILTNFVNEVNKIFNLDIDIEVYIPGHDYDEQYAIYTAICHSDEKGAILYLAKELFPEKDFSQYTDGEICNYLYENYFS